MKKNIAIFLSLFALISFATSCSDDEVEINDEILNLNISGLEDLGTDYKYEGWIIVDGAPVSTGTFDVNSTGNMSTNSFTITGDNLSEASTFVLTIEPSPDSDSGPSPVHILAGDFSSDNASLSIDHGAALGNDFSSAAGNYILATPTNGADNDENSGIWFLDISSGSPMVGLDLPTLPAGWAYEGWVVIDGTPVTTGTFTSLNVVDDSDPYSGTMGGPPFPGEDFLVNAPSGLSFPTDLAGGTAVISIEPVPDNSSSPFTLKPLVGMIDADAVDHTVYSMGQNLSFPSGTASR